MFLLCLLQHKNPSDWKNNMFSCTHSFGGHLCPARPVGAAAPGRRCLAVPPLAGFSLTAGGKGGWSVGYAPTCVCLMDQCRWWQLGQSAEISACSALCTKGWSRWGVTRAAAVAASSLSVWLSVCMSHTSLDVYSSDLICLSVTWASEMLWMAWIWALKNKWIYTN